MMYFVTQVALFGGGFGDYHITTVIRRWTH